MITQLDVVNLRGEVLSLPLVNPNGMYKLYSMEGLEPVGANIISSPFAGIDGEYYQSSNRGKRNVIVTVGLETDYQTMTVGELRSSMYKWFMTKAEVKLIITDDKLGVVETIGRVETVEAPLFVKDPAIRVSILCMDPDFLVREPVVEPANTVPNSLEFMIDYVGTEKTGIIFDMPITRPLSEFTIHHRTPYGTLHQLIFMGSLLTDDHLRIDTRSRNKTATVTRGAVTSSILSSIAPYSEWVTLQPGRNYFRIYATGAAIHNTITYSIRHGGL